MTLENLKVEINNILGSDFIIFFNTSHRVMEDYYNPDESTIGKATGIFSVSPSTISPLQGIQGITAECTLSTLIPVDDENRYRELYGKLNSLIEVTNGHIKDDDGTGYRYVMNWSLPRPTGVNVPVGEEYRQECVLNVTVILSAEGLFGNDIQITIDGQELKGIISWTEFEQKELIANLTINEFPADFIAQMSTYKLTVTYMNQDNELHRQMQRDAESREDKTYNIAQTINGLTKNYVAIREQYPLTGVLNEFQYVEMTFVEKLYE